MQDLYQLLRQKEMDIERVRREIEALRSVIPLLSEDAHDQASPVSASQSRRGGNGGVKGWPAERDHLSI